MWLGYFLAGYWLMAQQQVEWRGFVPSALSKMANMNFFKDVVKDYKINETSHAALKTGTR